MGRRVETFHEDLAELKHLLSTTRNRPGLIAIKLKEMKEGRFECTGGGRGRAPVRADASAHDGRDAWDSKVDGDWKDSKADGGWKDGGWKDSKGNKDDWKSGGWNPDSAENDKPEKKPEKP